MAKRKQRNDVEWFIALPDSEKERIYQEIDSKSTEQLLAESRPLNARERARLERFKRGVATGRGRPTKGQGAKAISITVERGLLDRADAYAASMGISRAALVAQALERAIR